ncbi:hypothetical protein [Streptococcus oricebi]|uniref:LXG domain-containing protein n=1 Tax=Streptococcus oricebi TaxID=1547447 RepID=A0ABS5B5U4_9STRE|nr:hypothetical protein [Streptococcus oricebi]MBP2624207.1 hypothetical protein [Streptococcus oricebi]
MAEKISIELTQQEALLLEIRSLTTTANELSTKLKTVVEGLPGLTSQGEVHNRMASEGANKLNRFISKAQTFQTLTEVIYGHTQETYSKFIDTDKLLALDIANSYLSSPEISAEERAYIKAHPSQAVSAFKESIQGGEIKDKMQGAKSSELLMRNGQKEGTR